jgi:hypothetical protein
MAFWKWYDRASRIDFAATLINLLSDWKGWVITAIGSGGGAVTFLWAAIRGRDPLDVWVLAVVVAAALMLIVYIAITFLERLKRPAVVSGPTASPTSDLMRDFQNGKWEIKLPPTRTPLPDGAKAEPYYTLSDTGRILEALFEISALIQEKAIPAREFAGRVSRNWSTDIPSGPSAFRGELKKAKVKIQEVTDAGWAISNKYQHYNDIIAPVLGGMSYSEKFVQASNELSDAIGSIPEPFNIPMKLLEPAIREYHTKLVAFENWVSETHTKAASETNRFRSAASGKRS